MKCNPTKPNPEGPFYRPGAPVRKKLNRSKGQKLIITGRIESKECKLLKNAMLDVWQANSEGQYDIEYIKDMKKYVLRGQIKAPAGKYRLETIYPGSYEIGPGVRRARHIHVKVYAPGYACLTTQLYFKGDPLIKQDPLVRKSLIVDLKERKGVLYGKMDFVLVKATKALYKIFRLG